jgi:HPt (histidine-containing phosphotransfer) domain-containing protein
MDDSATKPIDQERLLSLIRRWMPDSAAPAENTLLHTTVAPVSEPEASSPPPPDAQPMEMSSLLQRCMGDDKFVHTMLGKFQQTLRESLTAIEQAMSCGNADATSKSAHKLKGSASYLSAEPVRYFAAEIETLTQNGSMQGAEESLSQLRPQVQRCVDFIQRILAPASKGSECEALEFAED